jgi:hypothetical protein
MASTRSSRDADPEGEPRSKGPLGALLALLVLYSAGVSTWLLLRPAPATGGGGGGGETGSISEQLNENARRLRTETADDVDRRLRASEEKLAVAAKHVEDLATSVKALAESSVKRVDEATRGTGVRVENVDEKVEDLSKTVTAIRSSVDGLAAAVRSLEARPVSAPTATSTPPPAGSAPPTPAPTPAPTATPPEAPSDAPPTPEQIAANKEKVKAAIAELSTGDVNKIFPAAVFLGRAGDLDAVEPLIKVVREFKDPLGRSMAAQALGRLHACDAAPTLLSLFTEKNADVFLSAVQAFSKISMLDAGLSGDATKHEKQAAKDKWTQWWKDHEAETRRKWGQEKTEEPPPPAMGDAPK